MARLRGLTVLMIGIGAMVSLHIALHDLVPHHAQGAGIEAARSDHDHPTIGSDAALSARARLTAAVVTVEPLLDVPDVPIRPADSPAPLRCDEDVGLHLLHSVFLI